MIENVQKLYLYFELHCEQTSSKKIVTNKWRDQIWCVGPKTDGIIMKQTCSSDLLPIGMIADWHNHVHVGHADQT